MNLPEKLGRGHFAIVKLCAMADDAVGSAKLCFAKTSYEYIC